ncbi:hypothetical protein N9213_00230 [Akkermansiaceae bacterium]|nr:hypothetical protein [Akkermansiaceae bacterium]
MKIKALEKVAECWTSQGLLWAVTNGLEDYPVSVGRDLDVVVEKGRLRDAVQVVIDVLSPDGWVVLPNCQGWIWWVLAFKERKDGRLESLQIDLFEHLQWAFTWVVEGVGTDGALIRRGPFLEDPGGAVAKKFLLNGLSAGVKAFRNKPDYLNMPEPELAALPAVLKRVSGSERLEILRAIEERNLVGLEAHLSDLRKACYWYALKNTGRYRRLKSALQKQWVVNIAPQQGAPVIEVWGADQEQVRRLLTILEAELSELVFHRIELIQGDKNTLSSRKLLRLSCLQVVLIFSNRLLPKSISSDLTIRLEDGKKVLFFSRDRDRHSESLESSRVGIKNALLMIFKSKADLLIQTHNYLQPSKLATPKKLS